MKRVAFLDRDGVINRKAPEGQYVTRWEDMKFLPRSSEAISLLNRAGFLVVVVSNQRCVDKGLVTRDEVDALHSRMQREFKAAGALIDAVYYCPHGARPTCSCRKPRPGMLLSAARIHDIELEASWMIGDSESDIEAGRSAGCKTARVVRLDRGPQRSDLIAASLFDATHKILQMETVDTWPPQPIQLDRMIEPERMFANSMA
jgi:D-glycero-D-manno-heptose 1,7-bisphosphate phosphatase